MVVEEKLQPDSEETPSEREARSWLFVSLVIGELRRMGTTTLTCGFVFQPDLSMAGFWDTKRPQMERDLPSSGTFPCEALGRGPTT
jgi:hypothetical protein